MEKTINCENCNVEFTFEENPKYPRKYCLNCSAKKKQEWDGKGDQKYSKSGYGAPVKKPTEMFGGIEPKSTKEYHLSPEQVRSNALESSINVINGKNIMDGTKDVKELTTQMFLNLAEKFEEWINGQS